LRCAYVQEDPNLKPGLENTFFIRSASNKKTFSLAAENKEEMNDWIKFIQERIDIASFDDS